MNFSDEKKYIELEEKSEKENDEQCAKRFWEANLIRNDSVITDLFCGLFKSTITCPKCKGVSVTFEPFYSINLPLKENKNKKIITNEVYLKVLEKNIQINKEENVKMDQMNDKEILKAKAINEINTALKEKAIENFLSKIASQFFQDIATKFKNR